MSGRTGKLALLHFGSAVFLLAQASGLCAHEPLSCREDAMFILDASGSMAGGVGGNNLAKPRIDVVREAVNDVMPSITANRRVGLIVYGPGPYNVCTNIDLKLHPIPDAAEAIASSMADVVPAGRTPLTRAVELAADELRYRQRPGVIVLLTDGEETCGGDPCAVAKRLAAEGQDLVVHVIGYQLREAAGTLGTLQSRCIAEATGGLYASAETTDEIKKALRSMLGCPNLSQSERGSIGARTIAWRVKVNGCRVRSTVSWGGGWRTCQSAPSRSAGRRD